MKTRSICIKIVHQKKYDALVFFLSKDLGVFSIYIRGYRQFANKHRPLLDLGIEQDLEIEENHPFYQFKSTELIKEHSFNDYHCFVIFSFLCDMLSFIPQQTELNSEMLFASMTLTLQHLENNHAPFNASLFFQIKLIFELGEMGDLTQCQNCSTTLIENKDFVFDEFSFGLICTECNKQTKNSINYQTIQIIKSWLNTAPINELNQFITKQQSLIIQKQIMTVLEHQLSYKMQRQFLDTFPELR